MKGGRREKEYAFSLYSRFSTTTYRCRRRPFNAIHRKVVARRRRDSRKAQGYQKRIIGSHTKGGTWLYNGVTKKKIEFKGSTTTLFIDKLSQHTSYN
ncbi:hypothetical protein P8452_12276 [Trifolium repens]|jgi:hypothetical protein|nr:hypothetical protein P8452_12276 [Trifolium repens]